MSKIVMTASDIDGKPIPEGQSPGTIICMFSDKRRGFFILDATDDQVRDLADKVTRSDRGDVLERLGVKT